jgi:signal transduction histidine kinase
LAEQRKQIEDIIQANRLVKVRELGLTQEIIRLKNEYKAKIRMKKHNLGSLKNDITADLEIIHKLTQKALNDDNLNLIIFEKCLSRLKNNWETLDHRLRNIDAENVFGPESEFDFDSYLKNYCTSNQDKKYKIRYELDIHSFEEINAQTLILVNPDDFKQVVENIISNAEKHGFNEGRNDYELIISASCDISSEMVVFEFRNNGTPAPTMTADQFALDGWRTPVNGSEGDGKGGAYISEMTRNFKGQFTPPTTIEGKLGNKETTITISFPAMIKLDDNE